MDQHSAPSRPLAAWVLASAACGALAMYLADPQRGRRRRALAKDKVRSLASRTGKALDIATRDLGNRAQGLRAQANHLVQRRPQLDDDMLLARIRQKMGRFTSHARAVQVLAADGRITLSGPVLAHEKAGLVEAVRRIAGVHEVEDRMEAHETAENISCLQGSGRQRGGGARRMHWTPASRALATLGGGTLGVVGLGWLMRGMRSSALPHAQPEESARPPA